VGLERAGVHHWRRSARVRPGDELASAFGDLERTSFGFQQIGSVALAVLGLGLFLQALA
jgi:hypothetical protein